MDPSCCTELPWWIMAAFFCVGWCFMLSAVSMVGGWYSLAQEYPIRERVAVDGRIYRWCSVTLNLLGGYNGSVNITVSCDGFLMHQMLVMSFMHPPIYIPFSAVDSLDYRFSLGILRRCSIRVGKHRIYLNGKVAEHVYEAYSSQRGDS